MGVTMKMTFARAFSGVWFFVLIALVVSGCSTTKKIDWTSRVGNYTYDQALMEFGPPDKSAKLEDGTLIADWVTQRGYPQTWVNYGYPYRRGYFFYPTYADTYTTYMPDYILRLTFGGDGKLRAWKKFTR